MNSETLYNSSSLAMSILLAALGIGLLTFSIVLARKPLVQQNNMHYYRETYETLLEDLNDNSIKSLRILPLMIGRRTLYTLVIVFLGDC